MAGRKQSIHAAGKITKSGNSLMVRLLKDVIECADLREGQNVSITAERGEVKIRPTDDVRDTTAKFMRECTRRYPRALAKLGE